MLTEVQNHIIDKINNLAVIDDPFPYGFIESIFPDDYYNTLLDLLPEDSDYHSSSDKRTPNPYSLENRRRISLVTDDFERLSEERQEFWGDLRMFLASPLFINALFDVFHEHLTKRYKSVETKLRLELLRDQTGYRIPPHTDASHKIFTLLFYLPKDDSSLNLGTSVYIPQDRDFRDEKGTQFPYELFDIHETAPYAPNSVFCFMKTDNSFHGREPINDDGVQRDLLNLSIQHRNRYVP